MSELFPARTIVLEYLSVADSTLMSDDEFLRWHETLRLPELIKTGSIAAATLYRNLKESLKEDQPRYLVIYRLDATDTETAQNEIVQSRLADGLKRLHMGIWDFLALRTSVGPPLRPPVRMPDGMPEALLVVPTLCADPSRQKEFNDWYLYTHFSDILKTPGLTQAHRYRSLNPHTEPDEAGYLALYEIDADDPAAVVRQIEQDDRQIRIPQGRMIDCIRLAWGSGAFRHIARRDS
jgi:hypothetical protein